MSYRNENLAAGARIDALEDEIQGLREENERLKMPQAASVGAAATANANAAAEAAGPNAQADGDARPKPPRAGRAFALTALALLGLFLVVSPGFLPFHVASFPTGPIAMLGILLGGAGIPMSLLRMLFPEIPIYARNEHGERELVHRSMRTRRILLGLSVAAYGVGLAIALLGTDT
jgi:hypothetical protein